MAEHSPTPWTVAPDYPLVTANDGGTFVCDCTRPGYAPGPVAHADAALIVRAVNAYADLLAACEAALPELEATLEAYCGDPSSDLRHAIASVRAALAKARQS
jgi:hypothetical protein